MNLPDLTKIHTLAFDLDGTLAFSKQPMPKSIAHDLGKLSFFFNIAIISGGDWPQFEKQVVPPLEAARFRMLRHFTMLPTCGAKKFILLGEWTQAEYSKNRYSLRPFEVDKITDSLEGATTLWTHYPRGIIYGPQIENRGTQITFSALGQDAPLEVKRAWDPDASKRKELKELLEQVLNHDHYEVRIGGATSIDITLANVDKKLAISEITPEGKEVGDGVLFFGDALFEGGNDWPVSQTKAICKKVVDHGETGAYLQEILVKV